MLGSWVRAPCESLIKVRQDYFLATRSRFTLLLLLFLKCRFGISLHLVCWIGIKYLPIINYSFYRHWWPYAKCKSLWWNHRSRRSPPNDEDPRGWPVREGQSAIHDFPCYKDATFPVIAEGKQERINTHTDNFWIIKPRGGHIQHSGGYSRLPIALHIKPDYPLSWFCMINWQFSASENRFLASKSLLGRNFAQNERCL